MTQDIKAYYGEKIGFYYAFMDHYNKFLIPVALVGLAFQLGVFVTNNYSGFLYLFLS